MGRSERKDCFDSSFLKGPGSLRLVEGHLLHPDSMAAALKGATHIFHCASPFIIDVPDPRSELIRPAVEGTRLVV